MTTGEDVTDGDHDGTNPVTTTPTSSTASPADTTPSDISLEQIFFAIGTDAPSLSDMTIYETTTRSFLGRDFEFNIIGQSHYIRSDDGTFHELCSCVPLNHIDGEHTNTVDLALGNEATIGVVEDGLQYRLTVSTLPLADFPRKEYDLAHRFAPDAYTTIDLSPPYFETYHTYPERDLAVRTRSELIFTDDVLSSSD